MKSYSIFKKKKKKRCMGLKDLATVGVTAIIAIPIISETAEAIRRI